MTIENIPCNNPLTNDVNLPITCVEIASYIFDGNCPSFDDLCRNMSIVYLNNSMALMELSQNYWFSLKYRRKNATLPRACLNPAMESTFQCSMTTTHNNDSLC